MMQSSKPYSVVVGGVIIGVLGAICFSSKAIFVKLAYREANVQAITLLALRMLFALPFFITSAIYASRKSDNVRFTGGQWAYIAGIGVLGYYISSLLDFVGLQYVTAGIERMVLFVYPTIVLIISALAFKVKIRPVQWLAVAITYVGLVIAFWGEAEIQPSDSSFVKGTILIFLCAITYAVYIVGSGRLIPLVGAAKFNSYAMSFAAISVLTHFFTSAHEPLTDQPLMIYLYTFMMAIVSTVIPSYLVAESIRRIGSDNTAIVASIGPVSTIIQAYLFLQEPIHALQIAGTVLIIAGVLMIGTRKSKAT